jgi:lipopolysaccharide transport system permease protein
MNTNINPLFFVLEEWCFEIQTFLQSLGMVILFLGILDSQIFINLIYTPIHFLNLIIFIFWAPLIICLLAARYTDIYQLVPIITQLIFLMSPILYQERNLGKLSFLADYNPIYKILALFRDSIMEGKFFFKESFTLLFLNSVMFFISLLLLNKYKKRLIFYFT